MRPSSAAATAAGSAPAFPIWVTPIKALLAWERMRTHEELQKQGALVQWSKEQLGGTILFVSHTWLSYSHPDGERNEKLGLIKAWLGAILDGTAKDILPQWAQGFSKADARRMTISAGAIRRDLLDGYVWLDLASIPQEHRENQILAIQSIPHYIAASTYFAVVAGAWIHADNASPRGVHAWTQRGWCRLEQLANFLSPVQKPMIVAQSRSFVESYMPCGHPITPCYRTSVGEGNFTVDDDRVRLGPVIESMIAQRRRHALAQGEMFMFRALHALADRLLLGTGTEVALEPTLAEWMSEMRLESANEADSHMSALHYAVLGGRVDIATALIDAGADVHAKTRADCQHVITWAQKGVNVLCLACAARNQPEMIQLLLSRGADPHAKHPKLGNAFMWAAVAFQGKEGDASDAVYNLDVLYRHDARLASAEMPLMGIPGLMMMPAVSVTALRHFLRTYPQIASTNMRRVDGVGSTILFHHMAYVSDPTYIGALLDEGFDVTVWGPPTKAASRAIMRLMRFLFRVSRWPSNSVVQFATTSSDHPPYLHVAALHAFHGAVQLLLDRGGLEVDAPNKMGMTAMHLAAFSGHESIVDLLLAAGASPHAKDEKRRTPAAWATRRGHVELAKKLDRAILDTAPSTTAPRAGRKYRVAEVAPVEGSA